MRTFSNFQMVSKRFSLTTRKTKNLLYRLWVMEDIEEETDRRTTLESHSEMSQSRPRDSREPLVRARSNDLFFMIAKMRKAVIKQMYLI